MTRVKDQSPSEKTHANSKKNENDSSDVQITVSDQPPRQSNMAEGNPGTVQSGMAATTVSLHHGPCADIRAPPPLSYSPKTLVFGVIGVILLLLIYELTNINFNDDIIAPMDDDPPVRVGRDFLTKPLTEKLPNRDDIQILQDSSNSDHIKGDHGEHFGDEKSAAEIKKGDDKKDVPPQEKETSHNSLKKEFGSNIENEKAHLTIGTGTEELVDGKKEDKGKNSKMKLVIIKTTVETTLAPDSR